MKSEKRNLSVALKLLDRSLHPIPVEEGGTLPLVVSERYVESRPSREEVAAWFSLWPTANVAIILGTFFGVVALELERGHDEFPPAGLDLHSRCIVQFPDGKLHVYYRASHGLRNLYGELAQGVNLLDKGSYVIIPPSVIGEVPVTYQKGSLIDEYMAYPPQWLDKKLKAYRKKQAKKVIFDGTGVRIVRKTRKKRSDVQRPKFKENPFFEPPETGDATG